MDGQNSEDGAAEKEKSCTPPGFLFVQPKQRKKEYWQCIKLVAPTMDEKMEGIRSYFCMATTRLNGSWVKLITLSQTWKRNTNGC